MKIPFLGPTYNGRSLDIDATRCVNFYLEPTQTQDNKTQLAMVHTPGTLIFSSVAGTTPIRGMYTFNSHLYAVVYNKLYEVDTDGTQTEIGTLSTNTGRVSFSDNGLSQNGVGGDQLILVDGTAGYLYNVGTTTFSTIASAGGWADLLTNAGPVQVTFLDGYFVATNNTMSYWVSDLYNGATWNALATSPVSGTSDIIRGVASHRQQLFFIKQNSTEVWYDAGVATTTGSPFMRVSGAVFDYGTVAPWSIANGGGMLFFLATQRMGNTGETIGVAAIQEYAPQIISTPAINYRIASSTTLINCFGYCYSDKGHLFYVLTNPDDDWTLVYDAASGMWHERSSFCNDFSTPKRHVSNSYAFFNNKHYVGDYRSPFILEMSESLYTDGGNKIHRWRSSQTIQDPGDLDNVFISALIMDMETGLGTTPTLQVVTAYPAGYDSVNLVNVLILADGSITGGVQLIGNAAPECYLAFSDDSGHTWSGVKTSALGASGSNFTRVKFRRLGKARNRVFKFMVSDPVKINISNVFVEMSK